MSLIPTGASARTASPANDKSEETTMNAISTYLDNSSSSTGKSDNLATGMVRPPGSFEELMRRLDRDDPQHFALAAQIEGKVELDAWRAALDSVQRRHPLLSVCIRADGLTAPHFRHAPGTPIPLRIVHGNVLHRCESELERELSTDFDPQEAPLIRAVLLHETRRAVLILSAHTSIADGLSLTFLIRDILCSVSGEKLDRLPLASSQEEMLGFMDEASEIASRDWHSNEAVEGPRVRRERSLTPHVRQLSLTPEITEKLRERARAEGTTVHGALCSALAVAGRRLASEWNGKAVRVLSPIATRRMLKVCESCGVYISAGFVSFEPWDEPTRFWDMARHARQSLSVARTFGGVTGVIGAIDQIVRRRLDAEATAQLESNLCAFELMVTNLGNLSFETNFGQLRLRNLWGPAVLAGQPGTQTIGAATANGALCLIHTSYEPIEALLEVAKQLLVSACNDGRYR